MGWWGEGQLSYYCSTSVMFKIFTALFQLRIFTVSHLK